jgi:hypothetical protein
MFTSPPAICFDKSLLPLFTAARPAPLEAEFNGALHSSKDLLLIALVSPPSIAISPNTIHSLPLSVLCCRCLSLLLVSATHSPLPEVELTETLQRFLEVIPIVPELTWYPLDLFILLDIHTTSPANIELALYNE